MEDHIERRSKVVKTEALQIDLQEDSNEIDEIQPILNPLLYYTVLKNLFKYLVVHELKVVRSVCTEWYKVSSPFLSRESRVGIACGQRHSHVSRFLHFNRSFGFLSIREGCRNKKLYTNFSIRNLRLATLTELQIFKIYGHYMRELSLFSIYFRNYDNILKLIYHELPHLVKLKMVSTRGTWDDVVDKYFDSLPAIEEEAEESFSINLTSLDISNYDKADINPDHYTLNLCNFLRKCSNLTELSFRGLYPFLTHCLNKVYEAHPTNVSSLTIQLLTFENPPCSFSFLQASRKILNTFPLKNLSMELKLPPQDWKILFQSSNFSHLKELSLVFKPIPLSQTCEFDDDYFTSIFLPSKNENGDSSSDFHPKFQNLKRLNLVFHPNHFDKNSRIQHNEKTIFPNVTSLSWKYQSPIFSYPCTTSTWHSNLPNVFQELSSLFPNIKCLEATIGSSANFRNLVTCFRNIEELSITQESCALADLDLLGPTRFFGANNSLMDKNAGEGIFSIPGLSRLYLSNDCLRLSNKSIQLGFLQMPQLSVLKLYSHTLHPKKPPSISRDCFQALQKKHFVSLDIDISKSGPRGTRHIFQC